MNGVRGKTVKDVSIVSITFTATKCAAKMLCQNALPKCSAKILCQNALPKCSAKMRHVLIQSPNSLYMFVDTDKCKID